MELATRMIEEAGVDAFIGPGTSGNTTKIGNEVAAQIAHAVHFAFGHFADADRPA